MSTKTDAAFTASQVSFKRVFTMDFMDTVTTYTINRSTLALTRDQTMHFYSGPKAGTKESSIATGTCTLAKPPADRKF
ncbi:hypothetical protein LJR168_003916 [Pseudoxanthomonas sp. LjRoot168]|uniref:hypothetical protein n=1 Tax=unclassified Pseudoxanthomonas TaxID=2645906 RepID=UPI003ECC53CA